jgi:tRNA(Ile)-lysidine synthase
LSLRSRDDTGLPPAPVMVSQFAAILAAIGGFETRPLIAVAVSGGPDSLALMLLADQWARMQGGQAWGLTVDHGLRHESADEARIVASWLDARGIPHATLRWSGQKPESGIQEAAREARYRLLTAWCRERFCLHLLTAHHFEDQIETHLIRRRAGSGIDGLAVISAVRELAGCRLVRPLLAVSRKRLAALLAAAAQPFLLDPSNLNPVFERGRLRLASMHPSLSPAPGARVGVTGRAPEWLATPSPGSFRARQAVLSHAAGEKQTRRSVEEVADFAADVRACGRARIAREHAVEALSARAVALHPAGFATLDPVPLAAADPDIAELLLSRVVSCLGGLRYPVRAARLTRLSTALAREPGRSRTLGGCRFVAWRGQVLVLRELAAAEAPILLEPGADLCWDRRFAVRLSPEATGSVTLGYLGQHAGARPPSSRGRVLPPLVYSVLPALWDERGIASMPHLGYSRPGRPVAARLSFRPDRPLIPPGFTVV